MRAYDTSPTRRDGCSFSTGWRIIIIYSRRLRTADDVKRAWLPRPDTSPTEEEEEEEKRNPLHLSRRSHSRLSGTKTIRCCCCSFLKSLSSLRVIVPTHSLRWCACGAISQSAWPGVAASFIIIITSSSSLCVWGGCCVVLHNYRPLGINLHRPWRPPCVLCTHPAAQRISNVVYQHTHTPRFFFFLFISVRCSKKEVERFHDIVGSTIRSTSFWTGKLRFFGIVRTTTITGLWKTQPKSHQNPGSCVYTPRFQRICLYRTVRDDATWPQQSSFLNRPQ